VKVRSGKTVSGPKTQSVSPVVVFVEQEAKEAWFFIMVRILLKSF
jgi:hypothetical protein